MEGLHVDLLSNILSAACEQDLSGGSTSPIDNAGVKFLARASCVSRSWRTAAFQVAQSHSWLELTGADPVHRNPKWSSTTSVVLRGISKLFRSVKKLDLYSFVEGARDRGREGRGDYPLPGAGAPTEEDEGIVVQMTDAIQGAGVEGFQRQIQSTVRPLDADSAEGDDAVAGAGAGVGIGLGDIGLGALLEANGGSLTSLCFEACHNSAFSSMSFCHIAEFCPSLTSLTLRALEPPLEITDDGMADVAIGCPNIEVFREEQNWPLTDYSLVKMGQHWSNLREFSLWRAQKITAVGFTALLHGCPRLSSLKLQNVRANLLYFNTDTGIDDVAITALPNLRWLELSGSAQLARPLSALLGSCVNLEMFESFTFRMKGGGSPWLSHAWRVIALRELMERLGATRPGLRINFSDQLRVVVDRRVEAAPLLLGWH